MNIDEINRRIDLGIANIISENELKESTDTNNQIFNCVKLHKYIVLHNTNDKAEYLPKVNNVRINDLYNGVCNNVNDSIANSVEFEEISKRLGITSRCVASKYKNSYHISNMVLINDSWYFFDSGLDKLLYDKNGQSSLELHFAGLGSYSYCKNLTPEALLPNNLNSQIEHVPDNIAKNDISKVIVNAISNGLYSDDDILVK